MPQWNNNDVPGQPRPGWRYQDVERDPMNWGCGRGGMAFAEHGTCERIYTSTLPKMLFEKIERTISQVLNPPSKQVIHCSKHKFRA